MYYHEIFRYLTKSFYNNIDNHALNNLISNFLGKCYKSKLKSLKYFFLKDEKMNTRNSSFYHNTYLMLFYDQFKDVYKAFLILGRNSKNKTHNGI